MWSDKAGIRAGAKPARGARATRSHDRMMAVVLFLMLAGFMLVGAGIFATVHFVVKPLGFQNADQRR